MVKKKKSKKVELPKIDGLGPKDLKRIRTALRQVWSWSEAHRLVRKRCLQPDGFSKCENPKCEQKIVAKVYVDHKKPCGVVDDGFIRRLFVASRFLQGLCAKCHRAKTKEDLKLIEAGKAKTNDDFF